MGVLDFHGRREDARLITGQGKYTSDWNLPGQLHAYFLRADRAHARILGIDAEAARVHPGVIAIFTGADVADAGFRPPGTMVNYPGRGGSQLKVPARPMLARDRVRFLGEEVALVVANTALAAQDAAELIAIDYDDLGAVAHPEDAIKPDAPQLYPDIPNNICFDYEYGDEARTTEAFARAAHITKIKLESQKVASVPMEPRACLAHYDAAADRYDVYVSNQGVSMMRGGLCGITGLTPDKVRIHAQDIGGGFGTRSGPYPEYVLLMWTAKKLGRPLKWVSSRSDNFATESPGRAITIEGALALDRDGRFLAIKVDWWCDQGAYLTGAGPLINTSNGSMTLSGVYRIPIGYGRHRLVLTNTAPTTAYRGAGRPDMAYTVERLVDEAAAEMGLDSISIRRMNFIPKEAFPYTNAANIVYDTGDFEGLLQAALRAADWQGFPARRAASERTGKLRGLGCGVFIEPSGGGVAPKDQASIKFEVQSKPAKLTLYALSGSSGQGHETAYPELVAATLGIPAERISLRAGDPIGTAGLIGNGTVGSRSTMAHAGALKMTALEVIKKGTLLAAKTLEAAPEDIEFAAGSFVVKGTDRRISLLDLAERCAPGAGEPHPLDSIGELPLSRSFPSGAHIAEVEIDPATGETDVLSYVAADDCGNVLNHTLVEGQLHGAVLQGAGQVFGEHSVYDRATAQLLTGSFMDYYLPRAGLIKSIDAHDLPQPTPNNPLGAKGVGEAGTTGALPTLVNAVMSALRPLGIQHLDMPFTPARVWAALQSAKGN